MEKTADRASSIVLEQFDAPWRDDVPVFGCCRRAVTSATESADLEEVALLDVSSRVTTIREAVDEDLPGHLDAHRCCAGHLANLAFDLPDLLAGLDAR